MLTDAEKTNALFAPLTEEQRLTHALEFAVWETEVYRDAIVRMLVNQAKEVLRRTR